LEATELRKIPQVNVLVLLLALAALIMLPQKALSGEIKGSIKAQGLRSPENIVVYLTKAPPTDLDLSKVKFVMDQRNLEFIPHVLPVLVGSTVKFPNNDAVDHNIFSMSRTKKFNLGSYKPGDSKAVLFDQPGVVEVRCDVHAEMAAYILVMKNPYFAVTDETGNFQIPDATYLHQVGLDDLPELAPGKYVIKTWHEKLKTQKEAITITANEDVTVKLTLKRGVPGVLYK
jgi:plastocyanin